ncbi:MAG: class I SAM-dependent methyltransferase, partial [Phycisphaerales bacterium]|nr:class I SAM-dependent methyltransferase [Phycisphaerales bacterium]
DVAAFDLSSPMIEVAREKLLRGSLKADLFVANMADFQIDRKFSLAIIAASGFMHLLTAKEQRQTFLNIKKHLTDGGILTFNHFQPHPVVQAKLMQSSPEEYRFRAEYINNEGKRERISDAGSYDYITQVMRGNWKFETLDDDGNIVASRTRPLTMRHTYRQEMEYLFELCGFDIMNVYNNYSCDAAKDNFIWVVKKL